MNNPEYIVVDEFATIVEAVRLALLDAGGPGTWPNLNYQYGYVTELNQTLVQWSENPTDAVKKYPLVWLEDQDLTINRGRSGAIYGIIDKVRVFIIQSSDKTLKAHDRMSQKFKPVILPIYRELIRQLDMSPVFSVQATAKAAERLEHSITHRYFWGEAQQSVLNDVVDCSIVTLRNLTVNNNLNCVPMGMLKN